MELRTYRAATMSDALALVRRELGPDAAVLRTREVCGARWFGLRPGRREIEITASREANVPRRFAQKAQSPVSSFNSAAQATYQRPQTSALPNMPGAIRQLPASPNEDEKLADLQAMVKELWRRTACNQADSFPPELSRLFTKLIQSEMCADAARELIERLRLESRGKLSDSAELGTQLRKIIASEIRVAGPIGLAVGRCRVAAFVGPTGVGKTTTIAKLASNFQRKENRRIGRIAVGALRTTTIRQAHPMIDFGDLPPEIVYTPRDMRETIARMAGMDLVLIDTAGITPKNEGRLRELKAFLDAASTDEVHLVLSSTASARGLQQAAEGFAALGTTAMIFTKIDESPELGNTLSVLRSSRMPLSYITNGQQVPNDIEAPDVQRLAKLILGEDESQKNHVCSKRPVPLVLTRSIKEG
ncbi:MAG: hypothetical protein ACWGMZ_10435 [Thermoguttaceae bacterium]